MSEELCLVRSGNWECRDVKGHSAPVHTWGQTDDMLLFNAGWMKDGCITLRVPVDRETALRLLRSGAKSYSDLNGCVSE